MIRSPFGMKKMPEPKTHSPMVSTKASRGLEKHLEETELRMGFWDQIKFNHETSQVLAQKLGEITVALVEKQRDEIVQKLMLELDINKKRAYAQYMEHVGHLNKELVQKSTLMERELREVMLEEVTQIYEEKAAWKKQIGDMNLSNEDRNYEMDKMEEWIKLARSQIDGKILTLVETHSTSLQVTLELLRDEAIRADDNDLGLSTQYPRSSK